MIRRILLVIYCTQFTLALNNFLSDEYIASLNERQSSWVAGRNFADVPRMMNVVKKLVSNVSPDEELPSFSKKYYIDDNSTEIPDVFDARQIWPQCASIGQVWDQGVCSAGWAVSAASVLSDRICIHSNYTKKPILAPEDLMSCCTKCRFGCDSGWPNFAWEYLNETGIPTGGPYGSNVGCKPYSNPPCGHFNGSEKISCDHEPGCISPCYKICESSTAIVYEKDLYYAQEYYRIDPIDRQIKLDIMQNGPVQATFAVWEDFLSYKSGVYIENVTSNYLGAQSVKLIGWGADEDDQPYWLAVNSWNTEWGDGGLFKWLINNTDSAMESQIYAALPYFPS